ncbi:TetR/AcrR family transcriptional regulator [Ancylobacter defluvii]|uniref:TetR family transcriptional regulator n=1 Tax=Ancylobacter defluvii TaxID=1282440 RepID=A0A9W6NAD3_9HYPH|nr:TetR/AcrR family transcriptional regulator [Ancylobacter defluvii]MBS7587156.1 TetR/AcrR family transcriptional regulator [Ancylobacter defluvii]GLK83470.1 TetR family transcriptional regulator [Ancylobacter defluvii]
MTQGTRRLGERRSGGRPSKEQAAALGEHVLDGARAVFCRKGVVNTSLDEIALQLGVSKHTIYRRYPNKDALLEAVIERDIQRFREALLAASTEAAAPGPLAALQHVAWRYVEIGSSREYAAFYLSICAEAAISATLRRQFAAWSQAALEPLVAAITSATVAGLLRAGDPQLVSEILVDLLEGVNNRARLRDDLDAECQGLEAMFEQRWHVFLALMAEGVRSS